MAKVIFVLCALTSLACSVLLMRAFHRSGERLLLWSGVCFAGLTINNVLVFVDLILVPEVSLIVFRSAVTLASVLTLIVALIWDGPRGAK